MITETSASRRKCSHIQRRARVLLMKIAVGGLLEEYVLRSRRKISILRIIEESIQIKLDLK
jgi:hypothetical protein